MSTQTYLVPHGTRLHKCFCPQCAESLVAVHQGDPFPNTDQPQQSESTNPSGHGALSMDWLTVKVVHLQKCQMVTAGCLKLPVRGLNWVATLFSSSALCCCAGALRAASVTASAACAMINDGFGEVIVAVGSKGCNYWWDVTCHQRRQLLHTAYTLRPFVR